MFIVDPDFFSSRIPDPKQKQRWGKNLLFYLFCGHKFNKIKKFKIFQQSTSTEKILSQLTKNLCIFTQKILTKLSEIWVG
jgi:hypothetical protein